MVDSFAFHHVGVAVVDLQQALAFYSSAFGLRLVSGPFEDPLQKVQVCFLADAGRDSGYLELISPMEKESPLNCYLNDGVGAYHVCYEVADPGKALIELRARKCLVIAQPVPAVAFGGRKIAWCLTPTRQLIELLERGASSSPVQSKA